MNIVIARFLAFGDVLLTLPLAQALRRNPAVRRVDLITSAEFADIPRVSGFFDSVHRVGPAFSGPSPAGRSYDLLVDLHARSVRLPEPMERVLETVDASRRVRFAPQWETLRPGELPTRGWNEHAVEYYARGAGSLVSGPLPDGRIDLPAADRRWAAAQAVEGTVCVVPGARYEFKRWPESSFAALAELLRAQGVEAVVVGHPFDADVVHRVAAMAACRQVIEPNELRLGAIMALAGVAITNNTGLMHLAQASGATCVCVHSHTSPIMWRPWGVGHINLVGEPHECACPDIGDFEAPFPCGKRIRPAAVAAAVVEAVRTRALTGTGSGG
jgi:ADP-heptose:LPS heptosyltransferase